MYYKDKYIMHWKEIGYSFDIICFVLFVLYYFLLKLFMEIWPINLHKTYCFNMK